MIEQVNQIIGYLQSKKWGEHTPDRLVDAQGKLSVLLSNVGKEVAQARNEMDVMELGAKQYEADRFLHYKASMSIEESKYNARIDTFNHWTKHLDAKHAYNDLRAVYDAMTTMIVSIQVTLREKQKDYNSSQYQ